MIRYTLTPQPRCNMCGSSKRKLLGLRLNRSQGFRPRTVGGVAVSVKKCLDCELIYADPQPVPFNVADHYDVNPTEYFAEGYFEEDAGSFDVATASRLLGGSRLRALDIGAGVGKTMRALTYAGWDVYGLEPSQSFVDYAVRKGGLRPDRIQPSTVEQADFEPGFFDLITFGAVLEHLYYPSEMLQRALSWVRPGGIIHAEVPSSRYAVPKFLNAYFRGWGTSYVSHLSPMHPPYHLYEFSHRSFEKNGKTMGYHVAKFHYWAGTMPNPLHRILAPLMKRTGSGMQLTVWLRRNMGNDPAAPTAA